MKLTIGKQILFGYGLAMLCMAITGIAAYRSTQQLLEANNWVWHSFLVIGEAENLRANLLELESAGRGYLVTGDERFLESMETFQADLAESQKSIRTLTADSASEQRRMDVLDPRINRRLTDLMSILGARRARGFPAALSAMEQADVRQHTAEIRNLLAAIGSEERTLLNGREGRAQREAQTANRIILYGSLLGLALAAGIGIVTHLYIRRRLGEFQQLMTSVGDGDLTGRPAREGADELGKLAHGLNQVVTRLRNTTTQTRAATENLYSAAVEILASAREQSAVNGQQVAAYQETNATMQQVSQSCLQMSEKAKEVTTTAEAVSSASISGLDAVQKANQTVEAIHEQAEAVAQNIVSLSEKTQMVGDILATVNDIAEQSHLLALNANIGQSVQAFQQIVAGSNQQLIGFENVMQAMKDLSRSSEQANITTRQTEKAAASLTELGTQLRSATEGYRL